MAINVKDAAAAAAKFAQRAGSASGEYAANAEAAANSWATNAAAASSTFVQAVTAAGVEQRFKRGVQRAGSAKYADRVRSLGASRYGPGVSAGQADYQANVAPYLQTLASLTLPQRRPRGDPGNIQRVTSVINALHAKRIASMAGG